MRAPQFGPGKVRDKRDYFATNVPTGPNPEAAKGLRVKPFANIFALVEGLGVISLHQTEPEAQTALEAERERRRQFNAAQHRDDTFEPELCHHCGVSYRGPTIYCSLECATDDL